ncbi:MAG: hypothetical protein K2X93_20700 [Candidatus Obscuribacterales bacterium]|nr:hypothetical protein [Candidatus Obscuribacterales bacterium]
MTSSTPSSATQMQDNNSAEPKLKSLRQPAWHIIVLSVFSLSLYLVYWYYKTVRDIKGYALKVESEGAPTADRCDVLSKYTKARPFLASILLVAPTALAPLFLSLMPEAAIRATMPLIPLILLGFFAFLFRDIAALGVDQSLLRRNPSYAAFALTISMAMLWVLHKSGGAFYLMFTLVSIAPAIAQHWLNNYWQRVEPEETLVRRSFSGGELVTLILGSFILTLIMLTPTFDVAKPTKNIESSNAVSTGKPH